MYSRKRRVLVATASRLDSTTGIGKFLGEVLTQSGAQVEVKSLAQVDSLKGYDKVILGSPIRYDRWLPEAATFVETHQRTLRDLPVALFFTCLVLTKDTPEAKDKANNYAQKIARLLPSVDPNEIGRFAGMLDTSRASWPKRLALKGLSLASGVREGDYRDWEAIREWGQSL